MLNSDAASTMHYMDTKIYGKKIALIATNSCGHIDVNG